MSKLTDEIQNFTILIHKLCTQFYKYFYANRNTPSYGLRLYILLANEMKNNYHSALMDYLDISAKNLTDWGTRTAS